MSSVKFIPASGKPESGLMVIGEAPGEQEDKQGRPFCGRAGKLLDKLLAYIDLNRNNVYVTNVIKVRPTRSDLNHLQSSSPLLNEILKNRTPDDEELQSWRPLLLIEIKAVEPKVILTLGACATKTLIGWQKFTNMGTARGRIFTLQNGIKVVPSWHPAYLLRKSGDKIINEQVKNDLKIVRTLLN